MATQLPDGVRLLRTLTGHYDSIGRIGWSPDGRLLATPSTHGTIRIWDAASGECLRVIQGRHGDVIAAAFDPDGLILAAGGAGGTALWDVESWELRTTLDSGICNDVVFSPRDRIPCCGRCRTGGNSERSTGTRNRSSRSLSIRVARFWPVRASAALSGCGTWPLATPSRSSRAIPAWCALSLVLPGWPGARVEERG